jgi:hypothetical protein
MKTETLPTDITANQHHTTNEDQAAVARFAPPPLKLWPPQLHIVKETERIAALNKARMTYATVDQQAKCLCTSCLCELLVTALREELVFSNLPDTYDWSEKVTEFYAVTEPFTATEIELLDTDDEEHIRRTYPIMAQQIKQEIESRYLNRALADGRVRGMLSNRRNSSLINVMCARASALFGMHSRR